MRQYSPVDSFRDDPGELSDADRAAFHEGMISSGTRTSEKDIDEVLYG